MKKKFSLAMLLLVSAFIIFYRFADIPKNLSFDEVEFAKLALSLNSKPYTSYSPLATGHSTLYFYILLSSLKTFGISTFALRLPAAIFGILSVILFYLILKIIYQKNTIFNTYYLILNTFILLTSHWFLTFARFSFEATFLLFLELMSIYFILKFYEALKATAPFLRNSPEPMGVWRSKKTVSSFYLIISGLFAGLAFLSYTPGRIFFVLPLFFMILSFPRKREPSISGSPIRSRMTYILCFLIPFIIIISPLTIHLSTNVDTRIDQQFFLNNHEMPVNEKIAGLWHNISTTALMFNLKGDVNGRHNYPNKPALNPIIGILFIIGMIVSIKNFKNIYNKLFLVYFLISLLPTLMTYPWENPNMLRTYTVIPSIIYFIGLSIIFFINHINKINILKNYKYLILNTFYFLLIFSSFYELRTYFKYQPTVFKQAFEIKLPLDKAIKIKN